MSGRPKDLGPDPKPYSEDFAQSPDGFDVDALDLIEGHLKWSSLLRYRHPVTGQTWTVPNTDYNRPRLSRIESLQHDLDRYAAISLEYRLRGASYAYDGDRYRVIAARLEVQIEVLKAELAMVQKQRAAFLDQSATLPNDMPNAHQTTRWSAFEACAVVTGVPIKGATFMEWLAQRWTEWEAETGLDRTKADGSMHLAFDNWLRTWASNAMAQFVDQLAQERTDL